MPHCALLHLLTVLLIYSWQALRMTVSISRSRREQYSLGRAHASTIRHEPQHAAHRLLCAATTVPGCALPTMCTVAALIGVCRTCLLQAEAEKRCAEQLKLRRGVQVSLLRQSITNFWPVHEFVLSVQGLVEVKADKQRAEQLAEQAAEKWSPPSPEPAPRTPKQVRQWQSLSAMVVLTECLPASQLMCWAAAAQHMS